MLFKNKSKRATSRGSSGTPESPTDSTKTASQEISRIQSSATQSSGSGSPVDHDHLTIDPREALTRSDTNTTAKRKTALARLRSAIKKEDPFKDWPEDIYKPHEVPRPKYRRWVDPEHKQTLQAYSLRTAFATMRPKSFMSQYSPMGTRLSSRRNSVSSRGMIGSAFTSRNHSVVMVLAENENDNDEEDASSIANVDASKAVPVPRRRRDGEVAIADYSSVPELVQSSSLDSDDPDSFMSTNEPASLGDVSRSEGAFAPQFEKPFDGEELTRALTRKLIVAEA